MQKLSFGEAFRYPFRRWQRLFNILWGLVPIFGWLAIYGYQVKLVQEWVDGQFDQLPPFRFGANLKRGFWLFLKTLPLMVVSMALSIVMSWIGNIGVLIYMIIALFVFPLLFINLFVKETVNASFELDVLTPIGNTPGDYVIALLKTFGLAIVFGFMILVLIGLPASHFTQNIFMADYYRRHIA